MLGYGFNNNNNNNNNNNKGTLAVQTPHSLQK
jgi:hypothetical protein